MAYASELSSAPQTERYEVLSVLGRGGTSIVYRALDHRMNMQVALKSLRFTEEEDVYELKREFRFFRDIYHRNLVQLFDLHISSDACFFTMEAVDGVDFVSHFKEGQSDADLRSCLNQFALGLAALHSAGRLHRDLKPSNVLIGEGQRTVLLDFGLSAELGPSDELMTQHRLMAGTPGYMAPERLRGELATAGSDVYGLGVVLYETLAGQLPYPKDNPIQTYQAQSTPPAAPKDIRKEVPEDLSDLALALLAFDPKKRAGLMDVLEATRSRSESNVVSLSSWRPSLKHGYFVNRDAEMASLEAAFAESRAQRASLVTVAGVSGIGKSALIERFTDNMRSNEDALVLGSRCHPQEFVQQKAVDGLVDGLSRYLLVQSDERLRQLCPATLPALVSLFPVLRRVDFPYDLFEDETVISDPLELVDRATDALAEILSRLGETRPVILWIDDLQWSDHASVSFLEKIVRGKGLRNVLSILSYRADDIAAASKDTGAGVVHALLAEDQSDREVVVCSLDLQPLEAGEVRTLIELVSSGSVGSDDKTLDALMAQTGGLPYLATEYANYVGQTASETAEQPGSETGLVDVIGHRLSNLSSQQMALLQLVAVAGGPIDEGLLIELAKDEHATGQEIYELINLLLLRKGASEDEPLIEAYHDRIRRAVIEAMPVAHKQDLHLSIAGVMARQVTPDLGRLVGHYMDGGDAECAADYAAQAARQEVERYAYSDAIQFFELALAHKDWGQDRLALVVEYAEALGRAGRAAEAAEQYLAAGDIITENGGELADVPLLHAKAATNLLRSGQLTRGLDACRSVFDDFGFPFPENLKEAQSASLRNRLMAGPIGLAARLRKPSDPQGVRDRALVLWEAAASLMMMDFVVGDAVMSWHLRDVARLEDPMIKLRAKTSSAAGLSNLNAGWAQRRAKALLVEADAIATQEGSAEARVQVLAGQGGVAWFTGQWQASADISKEGIALARQEVADFDFVHSILRSYRLSALIVMGELEEVRPETRQALRDGERRGDAFVTRLFPTGFGALLDLADDNPEKALALADAALQDVHNNHFTSMHWSHFNGKGNTLLYTGSHSAFWDLMERQWPLVQKTGFLRLQAIATLLRYIRARGAVASLAARRKGQDFAGPDETSLRKIALEESKGISKFRNLPFSAPFAHTIAAGLAEIDGNTAQAIDELTRAAQGYHAADMKLHVAATGLHRARLDPSADAQELRTRCVSIMESEKINDMARFADMLSPGLGDTS